MEHKTEVSSEPEQTETPRLPIRVINLVGPDSYANPCAPPDTVTTFDTSKYTPPTSPQSDHEPNAEVEECEVDALNMVLEQVNKKRQGQPRNSCECCE